MVTPALASANRGTMRKLTQGWSVCSRRSIGACACSVDRLQLPQVLVVLLHVDVRVVDHGPLEPVDDRARLRHERRGIEAHAGRDGRREQHARDRGVDAGPEHEHPQHDAQRRSRRSGGAPPGDSRSAAARPRRPPPPSIVDVEVVRVEDRDDQHREQVVHDGEGGQEDLAAPAAPASRAAPARPARRRCPWPSGCPSRSCPGSPPTMSAKMIAGSDRAAQCGGHGQRRLAHAC